MREDQPVCPASEQLLGEIETTVVGTQYRNAAIAPGERANLEREPENRLDTCAIRVENGLFDHVGYLPRQISAWLSPLLDAGKIRVDGYVPGAADHATDHSTTCPITLPVFLFRKGKGLLSGREVRSKLDALHEVVRRAYEDAQGYPTAELILSIAEGLKPLTKQGLLPETRLLLALLPAVAREVRAAESVRAMARMRELLDALRIGAPLEHQNLTVFPLFWPESHGPSYTLLDPAIKDGAAVVEEASEDGDVPNLAVTNRGDRPILVTEGEILVGAKQNRVVNVTMLIAASHRSVLPVSRVEQGRWEHRERQVQAEYAAPPSLRSKKLKAVHRSRDRGDQPRGDQAQVWADVDVCLAGMGVKSKTASLTDGYVAAEEQLRAGRDQLPLPEDASGLPVARSGRIAGMDLFDSAATFGHLKERLLDAYLLDSLQNGRPSRNTSVEPRQFLERVATSVCPRSPSLGEGIELEIEGDGLVGSALLYEDQVCHLAAFSEAT